MQSVVVFAWVYFLAAVVAAAAGMNYGSPVLFGAALTSVLGGVLLLAVDRALVRLTEIRDALRGPQIPAAEDNYLTGKDTGAMPKSAADLTELDSRLEPARSKNQ
ncbi:MAG: hypothetical protein WAT09_20120 [Paracoccaceae bacterium]